MEAADEFRPEVILMDVGMPRLNGYEATRRIREQPWGKSIIIIALTGWGQEGDRLQSREPGATATWSSRSTFRIWRSSWRKPCRHNNLARSCPLLLGAVGD